MKKLAIIVSMSALVVLICALPVAAGNKIVNKIYGTYSALSHKETGKISHPIYDNNGKQTMKFGTACIAAEVFYENGKTASYNEKKVTINSDSPISVSTKNANAAVGYHIGYLKNVDGKVISSHKGFDMW